MTSLDVDIRIEQPGRPWWAPLAGWLESIVAFLPAHASTKRGRDTSRRIKIALGIAGGCSIVFGQAPVWVALGAISLLAMFFLPIPEVTKRRWKNRLERLRSGDPPPRTQTGQLTFDDTRLQLTTGRRTLTTLNFNADLRATTGTGDERRYLALHAPDANLKIRLTAPPDATDPVEFSTDTEASVDHSTPDFTAQLSFDDWNQFAPQIVSTIESVRNADTTA